MCLCVFFFKQKTAYEMRISDWSSDVCSSDLGLQGDADPGLRAAKPAAGAGDCAGLPGAGRSHGRRFRARGRSRGGVMPAPLRVQVIRDWPRRFEAVDLVLPAGATVADAVAASGFGAEGISGFAIHGERAVASTLLRDGDRVELLRPLEVDPKEARRRKAAGG